jgi:autotransporter strand-loop-strand O-heptosyltransferase
MNRPKIFAHGSYVGNTGYNQHTRDFFRSLSEHADIKVRNFTIGNSWKGYNLTPHDEEEYINEVDKKLLYQQILWDSNRVRQNHPIYPDKSKEFFPDVNIVLCETNHYIFYDQYTGPKIAYNVWESTLQPVEFFNKLKEFDELWVPSKWQRDCTISQGYDPEKIKVVPEGVDVKTFYPDNSISHTLTSDGRFKFFLAGRWDYRKSIKEIIETFLKTFDKNEPVDLILSVDNPFSGDGLKSTEERLEHYGLEDERLIVLHFPPRDEYIKLIKSCNVYVSCARSEGWNLPLIEAMACGTPSIYSNCSGQLEFAKNKGLPVKILGEKPANASDYNHFNESVGNYYEPNFDDLSRVMRYAYENYEGVKNGALKDSEDIRKNFIWENVAKIGSETINKFLEKKPKMEPSFQVNNTISVTYIEGPKVEILGSQDKKYYVEFVNRDTDEVLHSGTISNNMWIACAKKYYIPWQIKINGEVYEDFNLEGHTVLISMESKSLGDTIAWAPYTVEFAKKHKCNVLFSTFHNHFFEKLEAYKDITFTKPGSTHPCTAVYRLGWFRKNNKWGDEEKNPNQVNMIPLQKTATDILGLEYKELNYGLDFKPKERPIKNEYVVFGPNATAGCKEWSHENWAMLSIMLKEIGYEIITLTEKPYHLNGTKNIYGKPLDVVSNYLFHAKAFIGLGSGLSWFNWGLGNHTYMINGFARDGHEFSTNITRMYNDNVCIFCWNDEVFVFDTGDWDWCPVYKGTKKQHICQKSITPLQVFNKLKI